MITADFVNCLAAPSEEFLCPLSANAYKIDFTAFKIRAVDDGSEQVLYEIKKDPAEEEDIPDDEVDDSVRSIRYHFDPSFLDFKTIGTSLEFTIGDKPIHNFRMIERYYYKNVLIKSFDFTLPFVIPNTTNTWEVIYTVPDIDPALKEAIIRDPWATKSDSFYFVGDDLVMHNKAEYSYSPHA